MGQLDMPGDQNNLRTPQLVGFAPNLDSGLDSWAHSFVATVLLSSLFYPLYVHFPRGQFLSAPTITLTDDVIIKHPCTHNQILLHVPNIHTKMYMYIL